MNDPESAAGWECAYGHLHRDRGTADRCNAKKEEMLRRRVRKALSVISCGLGSRSYQDRANDSGVTRQRIGLKMQAARVSVNIAMINGCFGITPDFVRLICRNLSGVKKDMPEVIRLWPEEFRDLLPPQN